MATTILVLIYVLIAPYWFTTWFNFFKQDINLTAEEKHLSWLILVIATIFWPIVVPLAYLELLHRHQKIL